MDVCSRVQMLIAPIAAQYETRPEHWIHDWDEGLSFCFDCATKKVAELLAEEPEGDYIVDGGWGSEGDSLAFCETCSVALDNSFTDYAAEQEMDHFEEHDFDVTCPEDCHSLSNVIGAIGCGNDDLNKRIEALCQKILPQLEAASVQPITAH